MTGSGKEVVKVGWRGQGLLLSGTEQQLRVNEIHSQ